MKNGSVKVKQWDPVKQGDLLGQIGNSGDAFIPHLHFQVTDGKEMSSSLGVPAYFHDLKN